MSTQSQVFSAVNQKTNELFVKKGFEANYSLAGTFVATVVLQRQENFGPWVTIATLTTITASTLIHERTKDARYRMVCTAYTSGSPEATIEDAAIVDEGGGTIDSVVAGDDIEVDDSDPANPIITALQQTGRSLLTDFIYDLFDRAASNLHGSVTPTGQTWVCSGAGYLTAAIANRSISSPDNTYCSLPYGGNITRIGGAFSFESATGNNRTTANIVLIADNDAIGLNDMLHLIVCPNYWHLQKRVAGGVFATVVQGTHQLQEGAIYQVSMEIDLANGEVTVHPPQGAPITVADADIGVAIIPQHGVWQLGDIGSGFEPKWHAVYMGDLISDKLRALSGGIAGAEATVYNGRGASQRKRRIYQLDTVGWYRISNADTPMSLSIFGTVRISAITSYSMTLWEVKVNGNHDTSPYLVKLHGANAVGGAVDALRLSRANAANVALDLYLTASTPTTLVIDFDGYFNPVDPDANGEIPIGATALADEEVTLTNNHLGLAAAAQAAVANTAATNSSPYGYSTQAQADDLVTLVNEMRRVLIEQQLMKGSA